MKFLHTADLHIGKRIFEVSMIEDQRHILKQIHHIAKEEGVDAVVIAGDVYDRSVPSTDAVALLDQFLTELVDEKIAVIMISGNHDSPERVSFADRILERQGLYIAGNYQESMKCVTFKKNENSVTFVCMPFVKPAAAGGQTSAEAVEKMLASLSMPAEDNHNYILVTHYFVTGDGGEEPERAESETEVSVGGLDRVPASLFSHFAYVALGHLHKPQRIGCGHIFYAGSPIKYSFSEAKGDKSVNIVEIDGSGEVRVKKRLLEPLHEVRCIKGKLSELMSEEIVHSGLVSPEDYIQATLTDEEELIDPISSLRSVYPNVLQILLEKNRPKDDSGYESRLTGERKSTEELFSEFYEMLKGEPMDDRRRQIVKETAEEAGV